MEYFSETGGLFMLAIRLMQLFSDNRADYAKITGILGLMFQIRDDLLNLVSHDVSIETVQQSLTISSRIFI